MFLYYPVPWWFKSKPRKSLDTWFSKVRIDPTKGSSSIPAGCVEVWVHPKNSHVITIFHISLQLFCSYWSYIAFWYFWSTFRSLDLKASPASICNVAEKASKPGDRFPLVVVSLCLRYCKTNLSVSDPGFSFSPFPGMCCVLQIYWSDKPIVLH